MTGNDAKLDVGIDEHVGLPRTALLGLQHLLALTGIWIFPVLIGQALALDGQSVSWIIQACFFTTGIVTILQSTRILRLPVVQGPTGAFFLAVLTCGSVYGLGTTFGSMVVAGILFMLLSLPMKNWGLLGHLTRYVASPIVFGTLLVIVGASLANIGVSGWFGVPGSGGYGTGSFVTSVVTLATILLCMVFGGHGWLRKGALLWGILVGTVCAALTGNWHMPDMQQSTIVAAPTLLPFGFGVAWPVVVLMCIAFLQAGAEAMGIYSLLAGWGGQSMSRDRVHRGLFSEFLGCTVGALFGGLGTTSYPENVGIIKVSKVGSRYVTLAAGVIALLLSFSPILALFIAGLPSQVLSVASTVLFGIIAVSGIQMLARVQWDELNMAVAAPAFIVSLGVGAIPKDILDALPSFITSMLQPMMVGSVMLVVLNILVNHMARPWMERRRQQMLHEGSSPTINA